MPKKPEIFKIDASLDELAKKTLQEISLPVLPKSPFAKWKGKIDLGENELDCYVLDTEQRVIALSATVYAITGS